MTALKAQDVITMKNGDEIQAKVIEVGTEEIKYKIYGTDDSPLYVISKSNVFMIKYKNGSKDMFTGKLSPQKTDTTIDYYVLGMKDADKYYGSKTLGSATGTYFATFLGSPLIGLIPAIACSSTEPSIRNLNIRDMKMESNDTYMQSYQNEAFKIKKRKTWTNYGIGAACYLVLVYALIASESH